MTFAFISQSAATSGSTSATPSYPSGGAAGVVAIATVISGHPTASTLPSVPDGWSRLGTVVGTSGSYGADAGPRRVSFYIRILESASDPQPTFTIDSGTDSLISAMITHLSRNTAQALRWAVATGEDTSSGTGFSVTGAATSFAPSDFVLLAGVSNSDATPGWSAQAISAASITFGAVTERSEGSSSVGADFTFSISTCSVSSGTATSAPTFTATLAGAAIGVGGILRLRDATLATLSAVYDDTLSRVVLTTSTLDSIADEALIERSINAGITWTTVRGGTAVPVTAGTATLADYEFGPSVSNMYRITATDTDTGFDTDTGVTTTITPNPTRIWIKSIARPFLNTPVEVRLPSTVVMTRPARSGVFDIVGRSLPVAVNDVRKSRRWTMYIHTETEEESDGVELLLASGDTLYVQATPSCEISVPVGYVSAADATYDWHPLRPLMRLWTLPLTEVAAPGPDVVGASSTWTSVLAEYASWTAVLAAHSTWADLLTLIGDPTEVLVP